MATRRSRKSRRSRASRRHGNSADSRHGKVDSILVVGRRWFQRGPGNTYHSVNIYVNGKLVHRIPFAYGYDRMFEQNAEVWLIENGYIRAEKYKHGGGYPPMWQLAKDQGFTYEATVSDVARKKDL